MRSRKEITGILLLFLVTLGFLFLRFDQYFLSPNSKVIEPYGDGYKAYGTIIYHAKYDSTYSYYEGMNYPYGEHVVPAATQPLLSNTIKFISDNIVDITDYSIGILHFSILFGLVLCALFLYLIFRRLQLPVWYSITIALGLTILAPQIDRISSHYGLAHPEVIPIILFLLLRFDDHPGFRNSLWIALAVFLIAQIHFYYFAILTFTIGFYFFFRFLQGPSWKKLAGSTLYFSVQVGLPLLFFFWWMYFNDPVSDRTTAPWGFFAYRAFPEGIFTSLSEPHWQWFDQQVARIKRVDMESRSYIGLVAIIFLGIVLVNFFRKRFKEPVINLKEVNNRFWNALFWSSVAILIFSFGIPFIIPPFDKLLDFTGPIRQFRSIGRFSWVFFYVINILAFTSLYQWLENEKNTLRSIVLGAAVVLLLVEAYFYNFSENLELDTIEEFAPGQRFTDIPDINFKDFQAILPVPYYNIGSDNFWWHLSGFIGQKSITLSMQTGLPVTGAMLTRTSLSQTINQIQLVTEPYRSPRIFSDYPNDKPLLMAWDTIRVKEFPGQYDHLLEGSSQIHLSGPLQLLRLPLSSFEERIAARQKDIQERITTDSSLFKIEGFLTRDSLHNFIYNSFDNMASSNVYKGGGAFTGLTNDWNIIFEGTIPEESPRKYLLSFWMFINADLYPRSNIQVIKKDPESGLESVVWGGQVRELVRVIDNNGWGLVEVPFDSSDSVSSFQVVVQNPELKRKPLYIDELLIRPLDNELFMETERFLWNNNRWFPK